MPSKVETKTKADINDIKKQGSQRDLETLHPDLLDHKDKYDLWEALYIGGDEIEGKEEFLTQHGLETDTEFQVRLERAVYRNYCKPIVGVWNTHIWRKDPVRDPFPPPLEDYLVNVDRRGTRANKFFANITNIALYQGVSFVGIDAPVNRGEIKSQREANESGFRPYMYNIQTTDILDWAFEIAPDGSKRLAYVVVREVVETEAIPFEQHTKMFQYKVWYPDHWELYIAGDKAGDIVQIDEGPNHVGEIPIVPFYFEELYPMIGKSVTADIASLCKKIYKKENEKDISEFYTAIPIWFFRGFSDEELMQFKASSTNGVRTDNIDAELSVVECQGKAIDSIRTTVQEDVSAVYEISLRQMRPQTKQVSSYESKELDKIQFDTQLAKVAKDWADAEIKCWELLAKYANVEGDIAIKYNDDYQIEKVAKDLLAEFHKLRQSDDISRETLLGRLKAWEMLPEEFDIEEEIDRLATEGQPTPFTTLAAETLGGEM